ncbi:MAG TPA: hypothetical protein VFW22_15240 [Pseudolabrys sp.]|nr:hypothetical protein [Pseudolabrys sp.]
MKNVLLVLSVCALALPAITSAKDRKATLAPEPIVVNRSLFGGSESGLYDFGWLKPDCSTEFADVWIVRPPESGDIRFEEATSVVAGEKTDVQRLCHGKSGKVVRLFYKSKDNFTGRDRFVLDVDTKLGFVKRYAFTVDVR